MTLRTLGMGADPAAEAAAAEAMAAADKAQRTADNARGMVLTRDARFNTLDERIAALSALTDAQATSTARLDSLASSYTSALASSVADRAGLHDAIALLQAQVAAGAATATTDRERVIALQARLAAEVARVEALVATEKARALAAEQALKATTDADRQVAAAAQAALSARLAALEARVPVATSGRAVITTGLSLLGGATYNVVVPFDAPAPDATYLPLPVLDSTTLSLYSALDVVGIDQRTTISCRVIVKNTTLISVAGALAVTVLALKV